MNFNPFRYSILIILWFHISPALATGEFEDFINKKSTASAQDQQKAAEVFAGTWVLSSDTEGKKQSPPRPGFIQVLSTGDLFTSENHFNDGGWLNTTSNHHTVGSWQLNIEKSLPISKAVIAEAQAYIREMQNKIDDQDKKIAARFPEAKNIRPDQRKAFIAKHRQELEAILDDKTLNRFGLRRAKDLLPMLQQGIEDGQTKLYFGGLKTTMSGKYKRSTNYKTKRDFDALNYERRMTTYLTGQKLYLSDLRRNGMRNIVFEKPPVLPKNYPEAIANYYNNELVQAVKKRADEIYTDLNKICAHWRKIETELPANAVNNCRKQRDSLLALGIDKQDELKFIDERSVRVPDGIKRLVDFSSSPVDLTLIPSELPFLGYCFSYTSPEHNEKMLAQLENQGYANAAFTVAVSPSLGIKPANWSTQEFEAYRSIGLNIEVLHLRPDGVIGISQSTNSKPKNSLVMFYDKSNTWHHHDNKIDLSFHGGKVSRTLYVGKSLYSSPGVQNSGDKDFYDDDSKMHLSRWDIHFIQSDARLYDSRKNTLNPTYKTAQKKVSHDSGECAYLGYAQQDAPLATPKVSATPETNPKLKAKKVISKSTTAPFVLSEYGHLKVIPRDPNAPIASDIKTMWAKGFYIHLKKDGIFGFNTDTPGPYLYLPVNRWQNKNGVFTLTLDKVVYVFTLPTKMSTGETTLTTVDSTWNAFEMTYTTKQKGVN